MENSHDMYYDKKLSFVLNFLSEDEIETLIAKLESRIDNYKRTGELSYKCNIFGKFSLEEKNLMKAELIEIQSILQSENSDEEEEEEEEGKESPSRTKLDVEKQIKEIESILLADSDDSDTDSAKIEDEKEQHKLNIEKVKRNIREFQSTEDNVESKKKEDLSSVDKVVSSSDIEKTDNTADITKHEDKKYPSFGEVQRKKIEKMLFSDEDTDDDNSDDESLQMSPTEESDTCDISGEQSESGAEESPEDRHADTPPEGNSEMECEESENPSNDSAPLSTIKQERDFIPEMDVEANPLEVSTQEEMEEEEAEDPLSLQDPLSVDTDQTSEKTEDDHSAIKQEGERKPDGSKMSVGKYDDINMRETFISKSICRLCYLLCRTPENLKRHEEQVHQDDREALERPFFCVKDLIYKCERCPHIPGFLTENLVNFHKRKDHNVKIPKKIMCHLCYKSFKLQKSVTVHQRKHHPEAEEYFGRVIAPAELTQDCPNCDLKFLTVTLLDYHKKTVHHIAEKGLEDGRDKNGFFSCKLCYSEFSRAGNLKQHIVRHKEDAHNYDRDIGEDELKYECSECSLRFLSDHLRQFHLTRVHRVREQGRETGEERNFKCELCYKVLRTQANYLQHRKVHSRDQEAFRRKISPEDCQFPCGPCGLHFISADVLKYHVLTNHQICKKTKSRQGEVRYQCILCYETCKEQKNMAKHANSFHSSELEFLLLSRELNDGDLKYPCPSCPLKFVSENCLNYHSARRHNSSENFRTEKREKYCNLCYVQYKLHRNLEEHKRKVHRAELEAFQREIHPSELTHSCKFCSKKFYSQPSLVFHCRQKHKKTLPTGSSSSKCKLCYRMFSNISNLQRHTEKIHRKEAEFLSGEIRTGDLKFACPQCEARFVSERIRERHLAEHKLDKYQHLKSKSYHKKLYTCQLCYSKYSHFSLLSQHFEKIHSQELSLLEANIEDSELVFKCDECDLKFLKNSFLSYHKARKHQETEKTDNYCRLCRHNLTKSSKLASHNKRIHDDVEDWAFTSEIPPDKLTFQCQVCGEGFLTENCVNFHSRMKHKKTFGNYCNLCRVDFKWGTNFRYHIENFHFSKIEMEAFGMKQNEEDLLYECLTCNKKFLTDNILKYHTSYFHKEKQAENQKKKNLAAPVSNTNDIVSNFMKVLNSIV